MDYIVIIRPIGLKRTCGVIEVLEQKNYLYVVVDLVVVANLDYDEKNCKSSGVNVYYCKDIFFSFF